MAAAGGSLGGWIAGDGPPTLLLHGGPGLSFEYLDDLGEELATDFRVAAYQQCGLEPSTLDGPFTIAQAVDDAVAVLDGLQWERALVVGHSWGGQLALRATAELSPRGFLKVVPGAGHFVWLDEPGCVNSALSRLATAHAGA